MRNAKLRVHNVELRVRNVELRILMYQCTREHVYNKVFNILLGPWALFQTQGGNGWHI